MGGVFGGLMNQWTINEEALAKNRSIDWQNHEAGQNAQSTMLGIVFPPWGAAWALGCAQDDDADLDPHNGWYINDRLVYGPSGQVMPPEDYDDLYFYYMGAPTPDDLFGQH